MHLLTIKTRGAVEQMRFDYVVNNDALIINVNEDPQTIDKVLLIIRGDSVLKDLHGKCIDSTVYLDC